ncbi:MAG TPA: sugar transferase [Cellulomonas sp.]
MTVLDDGRKPTTAEIAAIVDRRRPAAGPRRSWASTEPFVAGPRVALEGDEGVSWLAASSRYVRSTVVADVVAAVVAVVLGIWMRGWWGPSVALSLFTIVPSFLVAVTLGRGYDRRVVGDGPREIQAVLRAGVAAAVIPAVGTAFLKMPLERTIVLLGAVLLTVHSLVARRGLRRRLHASRAAGLATARTLVVGDADSVHRIVEQLRASTHHGYRVVGLCLPSVTDTPPQDGVPVLGAFADVAQVAYDHRIETVIVAGSELTGDALRRLTWALGRAGAGLIVAPGLVEVLGPRMAVRPTAGLSLLEVETVAPRGRLFAKAFLDRVLGTVLLLAATPVIGIGALAVKLTSRGAVFFRQTRVGVDGRHFTMIKLRSMYSDAEERREALLHRNEAEGMLFKMRNDPRVTPVGRVLRRFSVDELPQLWNVARGDMSLVGPRPPLPLEVDGYQDQVLRRLHVRPGLTGLWQVSGRSDLSWDESVQLDLRYVDNWSLAMDLLILWKTGRAVLKAKGAY